MGELGFSGGSAVATACEAMEKLNGPMTRFQAGEDGADAVSVYVHVNAADVEVSSASAVVVDVHLHPGAAFDVDGLSAEKMSMSMLMMLKRRIVLDASNRSEF